MEPIVEIGKGIYTVPQAARILKIDARKLGQWVRMYWEFDFIKDVPRTSEGQIAEYQSVYTSGKGRNRVFNFYTLIEMITVYSLRELGVSFKRIKEAHKVAAEVLETSYPFAVEGFMTDRKNVIHNIDEVTSIFMDEKRQLSFRQLIEPFCLKIDFDEVTGFARRYWPLGKEKAVLVDPDHRFGEPVIKGTNISTKMITRLVESGEPVHFVAEEYDISEQDVMDAIEFNKNAA